MKKSLLWILILLVSIFMISTFSLAGCKTTTTTETTAAETTATATAAAETTVAETSATEAAEPITITYWSWMLESKWPDVVDAIKKKFEADHPNVTVKVEFVSSYADYKTKLTTAVAGGEAPDIMQLWMGGIIEYTKSGALLDITKYVNEGFFPKDIYQSAWDAHTVEGKIAIVPTDMENEIVAYNVDMFKKYGLSIPKTNADLVNIAKVLKKDGIFGISLGNKDQWGGVDAYMTELAYADPEYKVRKAETGEISWVQPEFIKAAQNIIDKIDEGVYAPGANSMEHLTDALALFTQQKAAMLFPFGAYLIGGLDEATTGSFQYSAFPFPPYNEGDATLNIGTTAGRWGVSSNSKNPEVALEFLNYFLSDYGQNIIFDVGQSIPCRPIDLTSKTLSPAMEACLQAASDCKNQRMIFNSNVYNELYNIAQGLFGKEITAEKFAEDLQAAYEKK